MEYLSERDPRLAAVIEREGRIRRPVTPDLFEALVNSIVGQQISSKSAATVKGRMNVLLEGITPGTIAAATVESIQGCGMSMRKAGYIKGLAEYVASGELDLRRLHGLPDEEVHRSLTHIPGIGKWTAEMMMIFSMERLDILSYGDLAIRKGLCLLHRHRQITPKLYEKYRKLYSPYGSVASLYLWRIAGGAPVT
ncbi:MAG: DNA-3-methyladenine glycosylase [Clostridiales Family XIII bacterium]|jgi:DNA-3-methyladenine glycosylase II|nr:DNA-3-methyladenine glycosylase [Clostridiales Family XIII bacterium]